MTRRFFRLAAAAVLLAPAARADQIDRVLVADSAAVASRVATLNAKSLAVLPFRVQIGDQPASFQHGTASAQLAAKLQNLLVLTNPAGESGEYVVLGDAGKKAADAGRRRGKAFDWTTPEGRRALAMLSLPVVWEPATARTPDAYLTGTLKLTPDLTAATVELVAFSKDDPATLKPLGEVRDTAGRPIRVDRNVLADLGRSFAVAPEVLTKAHPGTTVGRTRAAVEPDQAASASASTGLTAAAGDEGATKFAGCPVELGVFYDGKAVPVAADGSQNFRTAATPPAGSAISFTLRNTSDKPVAALLTVDGRNVIRLNPAERADENGNRERWRKFVLEPGLKYEIRGWRDTLDGKGDKLITVDTEAESSARFDAMQPAVAGKIELLVFPANDLVPAVTAAPADAPPPPADPREDALAQADQATEASPLEQIDRAIGRTRSAAEAREFLLKKLPAGTAVAAARDGGLAVLMPPPAKLSGKPRGLAADGDTAATDGGATVEKGFRHTAGPAAGVSVRYYWKAN